MHNKTVHMVAFLLLVVGGLNWGLEAFGYNVINMILGGIPTLEKIVYILIALSAIYEVVTHKSSCKHCVGGGVSSDGDNTGGM